MEIEKFLDLGADLETKISDLYLKIATLTQDESTAKRLNDISRQKIDHASALKMSKDSPRETPNISLEVGIHEEGLKEVFYECRALKDRFKQNYDFLPSLIWLLGIENRFKRIYVEASTFISDPQLMKLFHTLAESGQAHVDTLYEIISVLQVP